MENHDFIFGSDFFAPHTLSSVNPNPLIALLDFAKDPCI